MKNTFDILLLLARPAAGKSEIINYLKQIDLTERIRRYHIGEFDIIDDFPMLWTWFEEDLILTHLGYPRLHTREDGCFKEQYLWDLLIERICLEYQKNIADVGDYHTKKTAIIEFSRGSEHGGFSRAFRHLSHEVVTRMAILYIDVSWEESLRKNRARFNPSRPHSILEHGLTDDKLRKLYRTNDWDEITANNPTSILINGVKVPYAIFDNEDDITTEGGLLLATHLEGILKQLWNLYIER